MNPKGFASVVVIILVAVIGSAVAGGTVYYSIKKRVATTISIPVPSVADVPTPVSPPPSSPPTPSTPALARNDSPVAVSPAPIKPTPISPPVLPRIAEVSSPAVIKNEPIPGAAVRWNFDYQNQTWKSNGNPPHCPEPLKLPAPVDVNLASSILYPGQIRGGDYKPHGGFRFDNHTDNQINVYAPLDGSLFKAARHLESGEVQYSLYFMNDCGLMYKLDHLRELTARFEETLNKIPMGGEGDSRTTEIRPAVFVAKGEHIATKVGFENFPGGHKDKNVFVDFGLYDLRKQNSVLYDAAFRAKHSNISEYGTHALCWFDYLKEPERTIVKNLPAGGMEGKTSDYCR